MEPTRAGMWVERRRVISAFCSLSFLTHNQREEWPVDGLHATGVLTHFNMSGASASRVPGMCSAWSLRQGRRAHIARSREAADPGRPTHAATSSCAAAPATAVNCHFPMGGQKRRARRHRGQSDTGHGAQ